MRLRYVALLAATTLTLSLAHQPAAPKPQAVPSIQTGWEAWDMTGWGNHPDPLYSTSPVPPPVQHHATYKIHKPSSSHTPTTSSHVSAGSTTRSSVYHGSIPDLIRSIFGSASGTALCIANRESRFDPSASNPAPPYAKGVFQLAHIWYDGTSAYGWVFDPFNAYQNVYHAWLLYENPSGPPSWGPWGGGC